MASINKATFQCSGCIITAASVRQFFSENPNFFGHRTKTDIEIATDNVMTIVVISGKKLDLGAYFALREQGIQVDKVPKKDAEWNWDDLFIPHSVQREQKHSSHSVSRRQRRPKVHLSVAA